MLCIFLVFSLDITRISLLDKAQLTAKQYSVEQHELRYTQIFVNDYWTTVLHNSRLAEFPDTELMNMEG